MTSAKSVGLFYPLPCSHSLTVVLCAFGSNPLSLSCSHNLLVLLSAYRLPLNADVICECPLFSSSSSDSFGDIPKSVSIPALMSTVDVRKCPKIYSGTVDPTRRAICQGHVIVKGVRAKHQTSKTLPIKWCCATISSFRIATLLAVIGMQIPLLSLTSLLRQD